MIGYIASGLAAGGGYALAGVGFSYTIGVSKVLNFAYGSFYMLGALLTGWLIGSGFGTGYLVSSLIVLLGVLVIGAVFTVVAVLPVVRRNETAVMIATLAASLIITNVALLLLGSGARFINSPYSNTTYLLGSGTVSQQAIITLVAAPVVTGALVLFTRRTTAGLRVRATAQDAVLASSTGIRTLNVFLAAVLIGVLLSALTGVLYGPTTVVDVFSGDAFLLKAFTVAALAGMGRLWGAVVVGIGLGILEAVFAGYISPAYATAFIYGVLIICLLFFPKGLFRGN